MKDLQEIIDNLPEDAEYVFAAIADDGKTKLTRSVADIKQILELQQKIEMLEGLVGNYESLNGELQEQNERLKILVEGQEDVIARQHLFIGELNR